VIKVSAKNEGFREMELSVTRRRFSYASIIRGWIRDRLNRVGRDLLQRRICRRLGNDPTRAIQSPSDAVDTADALLGPLSRHDAHYHDVWASVAVRPLAELLYAASKQLGGGRGIEWAWQALVNVEADDTVPGWRQAADIWDQGTPCPSQLLKVAELPPRQRDSVILMMHAAMAPWAPGRNGRPSW
jgi:hypothetical protein